MTPLEYFRFLVTGGRPGGSRPGSRPDFTAALMRQPLGPEAMDPTALVGARPYGSQPTPQTWPSTPGVYMPTGQEFDPAMSVGGTPAPRTPGSRYMPASGYASHHPFPEDLAAPYVPTNWPYPASPAPAGPPVAAPAVPQQLPFGPGHPGYVKGGIDPAVPGRLGEVRDWGLALPGRLRDALAPTDRQRAIVRGLPLDHGGTRMRGANDVGPPVLPPQGGGSYPGDEYDPPNGFAPNPADTNFGPPVLDDAPTAAVTAPLAAPAVEPHPVAPDYALDGGTPLAGQPQYVRGGASDAVLQERLAMIGSGLPPSTVNGRRLKPVDVRPLAAETMSIMPTPEAMARGREMRARPAVAAAAATPWESVTVAGSAALDPNATVGNEATPVSPAAPTGAVSYQDAVKRAAAAQPAVAGYEGLSRGDQLFLALMRGGAGMMEAAGRPGVSTGAAAGAGLGRGLDTMLSLQRDERAGKRQVQQDKIAARRAAVEEAGQEVGIRQRQEGIGLQRQQLAQGQRQHDARMGLEYAQLAETVKGRAATLASQEKIAQLNRDESALQRDADRGSREATATLTAQRELDEQTIRSATAEVDNARASRAREMGTPAGMSLKPLTPEEEQAVRTRVFLNAPGSRQYLVLKTAEVESRKEASIARAKKEIADPTQQRAAIAEIEAEAQRQKAAIDATRPRIRQ